MKKRMRIFRIAIYLALTVMATGYIIAGKTNPAKTTAVIEKGNHLPGRLTVPTATVTTETLHRESLNETIIAYGTVKPLPGKVNTFNVAYDCMVNRINVTKGQIVNRGDVLLEISPAPDVLLKMKQIQNELTMQEKKEKVLLDRFALKLTTREDILQVQGRIQQLKQNLNNLKTQGISQREKICTHSDGIVWAINSSAGKLFPAGACLIQIADRNQIIVSFGVELEDIRCLKNSQPVELISTSDPENSRTKGRIYIITHQVDPSSRLVTVLAKPDITSALTLNDFIEVRIKVRSNNSFVVPRRALLPDDRRFFLFTVQGNRAIKHYVNFGLETAEKIEIRSESLHEGDRIITAGNYELRDGMPVIVERNK